MKKSIVFVFAIFILMLLTLFFYPKLSFIESCDKNGCMLMRCSCLGSENITMSSIATNGDLTITGAGYCSGLTYSCTPKLREDTDVIVN